MSNLNSKDRGRDEQQDPGDDLRLLLLLPDVQDHDASSGVDHDGQEAEGQRHHRKKGERHGKTERVSENQFFVSGTFLGSVQVSEGYQGQGVDGLDGSLDHALNISGVGNNLKLCIFIIILG